MTTNPNGSSPLEELRGRELTAVTFVQDYLQLWFDGPGLNVNNPLTVRTGAVHVTSRQPGFRDALCSQITKTVSQVEFSPDQELAICFEGGARLSVSLRPSDYTTPEALYAHGLAAGALVL